MERALWVTAETPDHHLGGGNARQAHLIEALARRAETHLFVDGALRDERVRACVASVTEVGGAKPAKIEPASAVYKVGSGRYSFTANR